LPKFKFTYILPIFLLLIFACKQTKYVPEGQYLLKKYEVVQEGDKLEKDDLNAIIRQQANYKRLGVKWKLMAYNAVDSTKVADKRKKKNIELRQENKERRVKEREINEKRIRKAKEKGRSFYTHKTITLKDTVEPRKFIREWYKYKVGEPPVIFDSLLYNKSIEQLNAYLKTKGYYYGSAGGFVEYKKHGKCKVTYSVETGDQYIIDSTYYVCNNKDVEDAYKAFLLVQHDVPLINKPFDSDILGSYRNKVARFMRDSSFYGFSANHITYTADTSRLTMKVKLGILFGDRAVRSEANRDSMLLVPHQKTYIKEVYFHIADTSEYSGNFKERIETLKLPLYKGPFLTTLDTMYYDNIELKHSQLLDTSRMAYFLYNGSPVVMPRILEMQNYLEKGNQYKEKFAQTSYSGLLRMQLFKALKTELIEIPNSNELEVHYYLAPSKKQSYSFQPRATNSNGFLGVSASINYTNRNLFKGAERFTFSISGGFESQPPVFDKTIDGEQVQTAARSFNTLEFGPSVKLELPGLFPIRVSRISKKRRPQTVISSAYNYQKRSDFVRGTFQMNYTWKFIQSNTSLFEVGLPGVSVVKFVNITKTDEFAAKLNDLGDLFLLNAYSNQFIWQDWRFRYEYNIKEKPNRKGNSQFYLSTVFDPAGNILSAFRSFQDTVDNGQYALANVGYSQFARIDNEVIFSKPLGKERSVNMRLQLGGGLPYGNTTTSLPYDYSFFAGGANDNRGWRARGLGPGGYKYYLDTNRAATQIGDLRLGGSAEYRFAINSFFKGAFFLDAGNVWTTFFDEKRPGGQISKDMFSQLAVATGFGLRMDLEYFIIRVDLGVPIRNASLPKGEKWIFQGSRPQFEQEAFDTFGADWQTIVPGLFIPQVHFGIGYPF
jgi:hypothetical protein